MYPIVYSVPSANYHLLTSPIPILAGVQATRAEFEMIKETVLSHEGMDHHVVAYLDENKLEVPPRILQEFLPPIFSSELKQELQEEYLDFKLNVMKHKTTGIDISFSRNFNTALNIGIIMRKMIMDAIVKHIPQTCVYKQDGLLDVKEMGRQVFNCNLHDDLFMYCFVNTQMFASYLHRHFQQ